jgi:hypothetical protein
MAKKLTGEVHLSREVLAVLGRAQHRPWRRKVRM